MSKLLQRAVDSASERLVLLAPASGHGRLEKRFGHVEADSDMRTRLLHDMQRMRGRVYLADGAVTPAQLSADGRHRTAQDDRSWHILTRDQAGQVTACGWYLEHLRDVRVEDLRVRHCPLAQNIEWRSRVWRAVDQDITRARNSGLGYVEVGGWAAAKVGSIAIDGLLLALAGYSLSRLRGGAIGLTTATVRHCSSTILRRMGGSRLEIDDTSIPSYYDPQYGCDMELLRFDSRSPNPSYEELINRLSDRLSEVLVVTATEPSHAKSADAPLWLPSTTRAQHPVALAS